MDECRHTRGIRDVTPSALGCEECLKTGSPWVHLRLGRTCGHVGCCDDSPNRHATRHFHATGHPIIEGYDPPEGWGWCYVDEVFIDLGDRTTPQIGPIPRFVEFDRQVRSGAPHLLLPPRSNETWHFLKPRGRAPRKSPRGGRHCPIVGGFSGVVYTEHLLGS